jgi:molecular chaperone DnaK (HSP70)/Fic family protein
MPEPRPTKLNSKSKELIVFKSFNEPTSEAMPSLLTYDHAAKSYVIGSRARDLARGGSLVVQDFKRFIGENDALFEGRYTSTKGARAQRVWLTRPDLADGQTRISTKQVVGHFLEALFRHIGEIPKQLIVGIPAIADESWQKNYRAHIGQVLVDLGYEKPIFFPEPFAVFHYYRHVQNLIPSSHHSLNILIVDIGGGTLDSCVIETTAEGNLARGGSTAVPLGVQSLQGAGKELDRKLLELALSKLQIPVLKQESPESRITSRPWVLLTAEEMKIALSNSMKGCRLEEDCSGFVERRFFAKGIYHPDAEFELVLNGEDLKKVVKDLWFQTWGSTTRNTLTQVKFRGGEVRTQRLDKVILAGGSSGLPFLSQLLAKTLAAERVEVRSNDIIVAQDSEKSVAYGLAVEAREQRKRALRTHHSIGPCIFNRLFLFVSTHRTEQPVKPYIKIKSGNDYVNQDPGTLLAGPIRSPGFKLDFEIKLPFKPHAALVYWFCENEEGTTPSLERLNVNQDILRLPPGVHKTFHLNLDFGLNGMVKPTFDFDGKKLEASPFLVTGLQVAQEVESFAGIDLGTSNTYVVNLWGERQTRESKFPAYSMSVSTGERLRQLEERITKLRSQKALETAKIQAFVNALESDYVFHSIKIEGSGLTRGETDELLSGKKAASSKETLEPENLRRAYEFVAQNCSAFKDAPEVFMREVDKLVLGQIDSRGGAYRSESVTISGMDFEPPNPIDVPAFMSQLASELKAGPSGRSVVQFATEAHNKLTSIHPFVDGNGRTARLLLNAILLDASLPPIIINFQDKQRYLDCLEASNSGDISPTVELISESMESALERIESVGKTVILNPIPEATSAAEVKIVHPPSEKLGDVIRRKISAIPANKEARYQAWVSAFDTFRKEVEACCLGVSEEFKQYRVVIRYRSYDSLAMEKYESLLRGQRVPRTWLMGIEIRLYDKSEKFVFFFRSMSDRFRKAILARHLEKGNPPLGVTLAVSRWVDGFYMQLVNEPVRLREIGYLNGAWFFLQQGTERDSEIIQAPIKQIFDDFLVESVEAFF